MCEPYCRRRIGGRRRRRRRCRRCRCRVSLAQHFLHSNVQQHIYGRGIFILRECVPV